MSLSGLHALEAKRSRRPVPLPAPRRPRKARYERLASVSDVGHAVSEIRNTKPENTNKSEFAQIQKIKPVAPMAARQMVQRRRFKLGAFGFGICFGFRISGFGFTKIGAYYFTCCDFRRLCCRPQLPAAGH